MLINIIRTDSSHPHFIELVKQLDADLAFRDGDDHAFYAQFNQIGKIKYAVVAYHDAEPVGSGAIKQFSEDAMEVKRMYTIPSHRGKGVATSVIRELEQWILDLGFSKAVLETGQNQPEAIAMYNKLGYQRIPNYGQYIGIENSVCFEKLLKT